MFNFFKKKCPICKMELKKGKNYPEGGFGKKFCSEKCKEEYRLKLLKELSKNKRRGCCG